MKPAIFGVLLTVFCTGLHSQRAGSVFVDDRLERALLWMFEKGVPQYYSDVPTAKTRNLLAEETGTGMYARARPNEPFCKLYFILWDIGISKITNDHTSTYCDVYCYEVDIQGTVVEYWVITKIDREVVYDKCRFIITVADTIRSSRQIVVDTYDFIESVEVGGRTIRFPKDNLNVLYSLDARRWPKSFTNSDLADYQVKYRRNGEPYLKKIGALGRTLYNFWHFRRNRRR